MVAFIGNSADSGGWNGSHTITDSDNALVFVGEGTDEGTPDFTSISSSADGAADYKQLIVHDGYAFGLAVWFNASAASHTISVSETDIGESASVLYEVSGLDSGETAAEDTSTGNEAASTSHTAGTVTAAGDAAMICVNDHDGSSGSITAPSPWTIDKDGSADLFMSRTVTGGATDDADYTSEFSITARGVIFVLKGEGAAPAGNQNFLTLLGVG